MTRERFAYDIAMACVSQYLQYSQPDRCCDCVDDAVKTFEIAYERVLSSGKPILEVVDRIRG